MRKLLKVGAAALGLAAMATSSMAADWTPPGPIKLMIAFRAGGGADTQARLIAEALEGKNLVGNSFPNKLRAREV